MRYYQCRLQQGDAHIVGWIEERGAKTAAAVELPELGGRWRVLTVCPTPVPHAWLKEKQRQDRKGMPDI
jgi:hypothetical protein